MNVVIKEGYSATAPDLSSLVTKLKRKRPDVILHTGYNPDITLFLRQAKEQGLRFKALIGHGAGYGVADKLYDALGNDVDHFYNVDPVSIWLLDPKSLKEGLADITEKVGMEYEKAKPDVKVKSAHVGMAASNAHMFFHRRAAARDQEIRRYRCGSIAPSGARDRHSRGRHLARFRGEVSG